jgi:hypothetical protein
VAHLGALQVKSYAMESAPRRHLISKTAEPVGMCARQGQLALLEYVRGYLNVKMDALKVVLVLVDALSIVVVETVDHVLLLAVVVVVLLAVHVQMAFAAFLAVCAVSMEVGVLSFCDPDISESNGDRVKLHDYKMSLLI